MIILKHLFLTGEFPRREELLSGLTLEQVTQRPAGMSHSIYEELWHAATYQRLVVDRTDSAYDGDHFPTTPPEHQQQWDDLTRSFLDGAHAAIAWADSPQLTAEVEPGVTMADELCSLAVHNAYHLGKIVALRQMIGAWPPKTST